MIFIPMLRHHLPFSFSFSHECMLRSSKGPMMCDITTDQMQKQMRIQLFSIKPDSKEICKNIKQCFSSHYFFF